MIKSVIRRALFYYFVALSLLRRVGGARGWRVAACRWRRWRNRSGGRNSPCWAPAHRGSSFDNPAIENNTFPGARARSGCWGRRGRRTLERSSVPVPPPSQTNPSPPNGSAVEGRVQNKPGLPRVSAQDERIIAAIKEGNSKTRSGWRLCPTGRPSLDNPVRRLTIFARMKIFSKRNSGPFRPLVPAAPSESSAGKETSDPRSVQSKPDVSDMSEESQRLAREIVRDTDKLGKVGNPGNGNAKSQAQQEFVGRFQQRHQCSAPADEYHGRNT